MYTISSTFLELTTKNVSSPSLELLPVPPALYFPLKALYYTHIFFRSVEDFDFYMAHKEIFIAGKIFHKVCGSIQGVPQIAQIVLIAKLLLDTTQKLMEVERAWERVHTISFQIFGFPSFFIQQEYAQKPIISKSSTLLTKLACYAPEVVIELALLIEEVVRSLFYTITALWTLTRVLIDLFDASSLDACTTHESCSGIGKNLVTSYETLIQNSYLLAQECEAYHEQITSLLQFFGSSIQAKELVPILLNSAHRIEQTQKVVTHSWNELKKSAVDASFDILFVHTGYASKHLISDNRLQKSAFYPIRNLHEYYSSTHPTRRTRNQLHTRFYETYQ